MPQLPSNEIDAGDDAPGGENAATPEGADAVTGGQPGAFEAKRIAEALATLSASDDRSEVDLFKKLTKPASAEEKRQIKEDAPAKPGKMDDFMSALKDALRNSAVDFALFGRMTTSDAFEDVEAAMQVAHAISTHAVVNEVDYWTAVDDLGKAGGGSGHLGEGMFNSACFYKYFCLDWDQLLRNLAPEPKKPDKKDNSPEMKQWHQDCGKWEKEIRPEAERLAACTLGHFIRAAALTTPTGKQNSFAAHNDPCGILVEIKKSGRMPVSYANAFAEPARKIGDPPDDAADCVSLIGRSIAQFADHVYQVRKAYGTDSTLLWHALPLYRYPLQGWEREPDGGKAKVRNEKGEPTAKDKPPVQFATKRFDVLTGADGKAEGLIEAVIREIGFDWSTVKDAGTAKPAGAAS
jgi:hypothetical protein